MKNILMLSTRHTKIGTLRRGIVYGLNEKDQDASKVIANLIKTKAGKELSAADVKKRNSKVESLAKKKAPVKGAADKAMKLAEKAVTAAEGERDKALEQIKDLTAKLEAAEQAAPASAAT